MTFDYFAYGSNLHPPRLVERTPSCEVLGTARLPGYQLRFHKRSRVVADASGKCDAYATGRSADVVYGAVYRIHRSEQATLDAAEGNGEGYERITTEALGAGGLVSVQLYVAQAAWIDPALNPYDWYLELVVRGARHHRLPATYRADLARTPVMADHDPARASHHFGLARKDPIGRESWRRG